MDFVLLATALISSRDRLLIVGGKSLTLLLKARCNTLLISVMGVGDPRAFYPGNKPNALESVPAVSDRKMFTF